MEGEKVQTTQAETVPNVDKWYTPLTRVTPLSKYLALALFVVLPFLGFWLGVRYAETLNQTDVITDTRYGYLREGTQDAHSSTTRPTSNLPSQRIRAFTLIPASNSQCDGIAPEVIKTVYGDIDVDGYEEAVVLGADCLAGIEPDLLSLFEIDGKTEPWEKFDIFASTAPTVLDHDELGFIGCLDINISPNNELILSYPRSLGMFRECAGATGGELRWYYVWNGDAFILSHLAYLTEGQVAGTAATSSLGAPGDYQMYDGQGAAYLLLPQTVPGHTYHIERSYDLSIWENVTISYGPSCWGAGTPEERCDRSFVDTDVTPGSDLLFYRYGERTSDGRVSEWSDVGSVVARTQE